VVGGRSYLTLGHFGLAPLLSRAISSLRGPSSRRRRRLRPERVSTTRPARSALIKLS